ncbi:MAG: M28 family peptidase [Planctomycetes bacterium]|nr:M28 family peptidase [Planctomycetota bacterium]
MRLGKGRFVARGVLFGSLMAMLAVLLAPLMAKESGSSDGLWMKRAAQFLASDELEGRGLETHGLRRAAEFMQEEFRSAGLEFLPDTENGFQTFSYAATSKLGEGNRLELHAADETPVALEINKDFVPLAMSGSGEVDLPLVFVGYGISAPELEYDDYAGIDVEGKAVVVLRHEPEQANPHSKFDGLENSRYAPLSTKVSNAYQHGAAAVVFCTDQFEIDKRTAEAKKRLQTALEQLEEARKQEVTPKKDEELARAEKRVARWKKKSEGDNDQLLAFSAGMGSTPRELPVIHCRREAMGKLFQAAGKPDLATLETNIDVGLQPQSVELTGCRLVGQVAIERELVDLVNVIGVLPGKGPLANETIVVGAHYDHLGRGEMGSAEPESKLIHNGADDNASGAVVLVDVARRLAAENGLSRRQIIFIGFSGEERGLLGSAYFVRNSPVPLKSVVAMVNFDMVGRLRENKLIASGADTATQFEGWLEEVNESYKFELVKQSGGYGPSDHATFYAKEIPVVHFFTGAHDDYHRPTDDFHLLNLDGMERISRFAAQWITKLATVDEKIEYQLVEQPRQATAKRDPRPYFGSIPDFGKVDEGYAISGVSANSPAAEAGLQGGDAIIKLGAHKIGNLEDFDNALRKFEAGDRVPIVFLREKERIDSEVVLDPPR